MNGLSEFYPVDNDQNAIKWENMTSHRSDAEIPLNLRRYFRWLSLNSDRSGHSPIVHLGSHDFRLRWRMLSIVSIGPDGVYEQPNSIISSRYGPTQFPSISGTRSQSISMIP